MSPDRNPKRHSEEEGRGAGPSKKPNMADESTRRLAIMGLLDDSNEVRRLEDLVAYQGFDPRAVRGILEKRGGTAAEYAKDVGTLIIILATRGTNLTKIAASSSVDGANIIRSLKNKYKIADPGAPLMKDTVTMSRIGACFPEEICRLLHSRPEIKYPGLNLPINMPKALVTPSAASLIPKTYGIQTLAMLNLHLEFLVQFDEMIHPKNPTPIDKIKTYQLAAFNSNLIDETQRLTIGIELGWFVLDEENDSMSLLSPFDEFHPKQMRNAGKNSYHMN